MKTQLVIMAAGIGSRFGKGIKQLERIGKNGEVIMEYSISEAKKAGFDEVVIIIRHEIEKDFKEIIGSRIEEKIKTVYAYQELNKLPSGFTAPSDRKKPYGTGHCLLCAKDLIDSPFLVINADDYYGVEGFKKIHDYLINTDLDKDGKMTGCMAGFKISNTLSDFGTVTRGVSKSDDDNNLKSVHETYEIKKNENGEIFGLDENENPVKVDINSLVSMNMWGLPHSILKEIEDRFIAFLEKNNQNVKSEYLLPMIIDELIKEGKMNIKVLKVNDKWYGITYAEDVDIVKEALKDRI